MKISNFVSQKNNVMEAIKIDVNKQMDGYSFSLMPSVRILIKTLFPGSNPANGIFVAYDTKSDFENYIVNLENYIYPALLGINESDDLKKKVDKIIFVDTHTGQEMMTLNPWKTIITFTWVEQAIWR